MYQEEELPSNYEQLLDVVGSEHTYQYRIVFVLSILWFLSSMYLYSFIILFISPQFFCLIDNQQQVINNINYQICQEGPDACVQQLVIENQSSIQSITMQYNLYCDQRVYNYLIEALFFIGGFLGILLSRKLMFFRQFGPFQLLKFQWFGMLILILIEIIFLNPIIFAVCYFFTGACCFSFLSVSLSYFRDYSDKSLFYDGRIAFFLTNCLGQVISILTQQLLNDWRAYFLWFIVIPMTIFGFMMICFFNESLKFQFLQNKGPQLLYQNFIEIAEINGNNFYDEDTFNFIYQIVRKQLRIDYFSYFNNNNNVDQQQQDELNNNQNNNELSYIQYNDSESQHNQHQNENEIQSNNLSIHSAPAVLKNSIQNNQINMYNNNGSNIFQNDNIQNQNQQQFQDNQIHINQHRSASFVIPGYQQQQRNQQHLHHHMQNSLSSLSSIQIENLPHLPQQNLQVPAMPFEQQIQEQQQQHQLQQNLEQLQQEIQIENQQIEKQMFNSKICIAIAIIEYSIYFGLCFVLNKVGMELGFNILVLAISEAVAIMTAENFIDFSNSRNALQYNLLVCGVILISFNMTFNSQICEQQMQLFCPERIMQLLLAGTTRFTNIFSFSFLFRIIKYDISQKEVVRITLWERVSYYGILGALIQLLIIYYNFFNIYQYLTFLSILAFFGSILTKRLK